MSQIGNQSTSACGGVGYVPIPPRLWSRAGGNNCPNCVSNNGYAACIGDNGLSYSTYALDQRRKAEILKYKGNSAQLSRAQQYSMASRNALTRKKSWATQTQTYTNPNVDNLPEIQNAGGVAVSLQCNGTTVRCSLTSDSDVPGPVIPLCIDESVPLYNYKLQVTPASGGTGIYNLDGLVLPPPPAPIPVPTPAPTPVPPPAPTPASVEVILEVINATGQRIYLDANKSPSQNITPTGYTGWIITNPNNLTSSACKILSSHSSPIPLSALVVAGGGASQTQTEDPEEGSIRWIGGGGGGGGVLSITSGASMVSGTQYNITVGKGGQTLNGEDSILNWNNGIATAIGGGGGSGNQSNINGQNGGSGGGAGFISQSQTGIAGSGTPGPPVQGYNGGAYNMGSGGGGGAGAPGSSNNGGDGAQSAITGTLSYYGGGGAGVGYGGNYGGTGGQGGGGSTSNLPGTDGLGGGAGSNYYGGIFPPTSIKGGNGVIILQFPSYY